MLSSEDQKKLKCLIAHDEGKRNFIYKDSMGNDTIGYGHLCANGFSDAVIDLIYEEDKNKVYNFLVKYFDWFSKLDAARSMAVISMAFNLGIPGFLKFKKFIAAMSKYAFSEAVQELSNSLWATQVPNRVKEICAIIESGKLPEGI